MTHACPPSHLLPLLEPLEPRLLLTGQPVGIADSLINEGDSGYVVHAFDVHLMFAQSTAASVDWRTLPGTADAMGIDYQAGYGATLYFEPGSTRPTTGIQVKVYGDTQGEQDEYFYIQLYNPVNLTIAGSVAMITILDNDAARIHSDSPTVVSEGDTGWISRTATVRRVGKTTNACSVDYSPIATTTPGVIAATPGVDYKGTSGTLHFAAGQTVATIPFQVQGDTIWEGMPEGFRFQFSNPQSCIFDAVAPNFADVFINNEDEPGFACPPAQLIEGNSGTHNMRFAVTVQGQLAANYSVNIYTEGGTATPNVDYTPVNVSLTFGPGSATTQYVDVPIIGDLLTESNEVFYLKESTSYESSPGAIEIVMGGLSTGTILSDELAWGLHVLSVGVRDPGPDFELAGDVAAGRVHDAFAQLPNVLNNELLVLNTGDSGNTWKLYNAIVSMRNLVHANDTFVFYFASHGAQPEDGDETAVLAQYNSAHPTWRHSAKGDEMMLLSRVNNLTPSDFVTDDAFSGYFRNNTIWNNVDKLFLIDTCYSGGFMGSVGTTDSGDLGTLPRAGVIAAAAEGDFGKATLDGSLGVYVHDFGNALANAVVALKDEPDLTYSDLFDQITVEGKVYNGKDGYITDITLPDGRTPVAIDFEPYQKLSANFVGGLAPWRALPFGGRQKATYYDADGDLVTVSLQGPGQGEVLLPTGSSADAESISLSGTTGQTQLVVQTARGRLTSVGGICADGELQAISASSTDLTEYCSVLGTLGSLVLHDTTGATIQIGGTPTSKPATLVFDQVKDTGLVSAMPLASLTATEWLDTDGVLQEIRAPWIGTLSIAGKTTVTPKIAGDFAANLTLSGNGVAAKGKTLGSATIKGSVASSVWDLTGPVGALIVSGTVGAVQQPWVLRNSAAIASLTFGDVIDGQVQGTANIGAVKATRWQAGSLSANTVTSISTTGAAATKTAAAIPGDFAADLTLAGVGVTPKTKTLGSASIKGNVGATTWDLTGPVGTLAITGTVGEAGTPWQLTGPSMVGTLALGDVTNAAVTVNGSLGAVKAMRWLAGAIQANMATSITTTGLPLAKPPVSGDFGAAVTLSGVGVTGLAKTLGSAAIAGNVGATTWDLTGPVGTLAITGTVGTVNQPWQLTHPTVLGGLTLGNVLHAAVTVAGDVGAVKAVRWLGGVVTAAKIASITTTGLACTKTAPAVLGNFGADVTVTGGGLKPVLGNLTVAGWLDGATILSTAGPVGTLTVGGMRDSTIQVGSVVVADVANHKTLGGLTVGGITGQAAPFFINSNVSAWTMGTVTLRDVLTANAGHTPQAFGVQAHTVATYSRYAGKAVAKKESNLTGQAPTFDPVGDYSVQLV